MKKLIIILLALMLTPAAFCGGKLSNDGTYPKAKKIVVKVALVIENPYIASEGKRFHEIFGWNDPVKLAAAYEAAMEEASGYVVDYKIVERIDADTLWTEIRPDEKSGPTGHPESIQTIYQCLKEPGWKTFRNGGTKYNYKEMIEYYGFDKKRDKDQVHEVWVFSWPYGGMWESTLAGEGAFWLNSRPVKGTTNKKLLTVMGLNFERNLDCAIESYGHRSESVMRQVYGEWRNGYHTDVDPAWELNNWELYTLFDRRAKGRAQVGNIHYPPNGLKDYDFVNKTNTVPCVAHVWANYPNLDVENAVPKMVNASEWGNTHEGYMRWWFSHLPNKAGINPKDGKLNNWWHYIVNYNEAVELEKKLNTK